MGRLAETWRGASILARCLVGAPLVSLRVIRETTAAPEAHRILKQTSERLMASTGWRVEVTGAPPPPGTGCVLCYNETSLVDVLAYMAGLLPHIDRAAGAEIYGRIPLARAAFRKANIELVARGDRQSTDRLMQEMVAAVRRGERLAWGGEGKLSGRDAVSRFKVGASLIAIRASAPLIPVAFYGGHRAMPLGSIRARPGPIRIHIGTPIATEGLHEDDARALADRTQATVAAMYDDLRTDGAAAALGRAS